METTMEAVAEKTVAPTAEHFMERARRRTRKRFTTEEKVRIVIEGMRREVSIAELARREGISTPLYYGWLTMKESAGKMRYSYFWLARNWKRLGFHPTDFGRHRMFEEREIDGYMRRNRFAYRGRPRKGRNGAQA